MTELQCIVTGKVQGVGYRDFVQIAAEELALTGYVQNRQDGSVYICAQGEPEILRQMVEYINEGSVLSEIIGVSVEWATAIKVFDDFSVTK